MNFEGMLLVQTLLSRGMTFELIPAVKWKVDILVEGSRDHFVVSFHRSISLGRYSGMKSQVVGNLRLLKQELSSC